MKAQRIFHVFASEFKLLLKKPMLIITFLAVALVPILYSGFLIEGTWNPYGQLEKLPIAVVNEDQGAEFEGEARNIGNEFVAELRANKEFDWGFVSEEEADLGMRNNHYYATITIPSAFSANAASIASEQPKQAELLFESNSFYNFVAGQIGESATKELRSQLSKTLTEAYSRSMVAQFGTISSGFRDASQGANELQTGAQALNAGIQEVSRNVSVLAGGVQQLNTNMSPLQKGAQQIAAGASELNKGAGELAGGAAQLQAAGVELEQGAQQAEEGTASLVKGLQTSKAGTDELTMGLASALAGSERLETGLTASAAASSGVASGAAEISAGLDQLAAAHPELASDAALKKLIAVSKTMAEGSKQLNEGQKQLLAGSQTLTTGHKQLATGVRQLSEGQQQLLQGAAQLQTGQRQLHSGLHDYNSKFPLLVTGSQQLQTGAAQVNQGSSGLADGVGKLGAGMDQLAAGASRLDQGTAELAEGAPKLVEGSRQLASQLSDAAQKTAAIKADDGKIRMLADPVKITANDNRKVQLYANGIAPYFISMALFAGGLVFTTIYAARTTSVTGASALRLLVSKLLTFGIMSVVQALVVCTVLIFLLGFQVRSIGLFYLFTVVVGLTFMLVIQMLVTWLDQPGRFVVLLLMIFQLSASAGTFPLELLPDWAQKLHPWLPMTYSIQGFRYVISSGQYAAMWQQAGYLAIFMLVSVLLTCLYFLKRRDTNNEEQLMPVKV